MAGITPQGFIPKTLREIREDMISACESIQAPDGSFPLFNISDDSVLSQLVGIFAAELEVAWGALADAYAQFDPQLNTGAGQSGTVQLNAITRTPGSASVLAVQLKALSGTLIARGSLISDSNATVMYAITEDVVAQGAQGQTVITSAYAEATTFGAFNPLVGTVNTIQTPIAGWYGVENTSTQVIGAEEESDADLRFRQQQSTALTSYRQIEAIWAAICNVPGVTYCRVYQNADTNPVDSRGIPFKEVSAVVEGGDSRAIAEALFYRLPDAQLGYGDVTEVFTDLQGFNYNISFSRPSPVLIFLELDILVYDTMAWPSNGADLIKQAIIDYARYSLVATGEGFPPGADVVLTRLYTPINTVPGFSVTSLKIGTSAAALSETDIPIAWNQLAVFDASNMTINIALD